MRQILRTVVVVRISNWLVVLVAVTSGACDMRHEQALLTALSPCESRWSAPLNATSLWPTK